MNGQSEQTIGKAQEQAFHPRRIGVMIVGDEVPHTHIHVVDQLRRRAVVPASRRGLSVESRPLRAKDGGRGLAFIHSPRVAAPSWDGEDAPSLGGWGWNWPSVLNSMLPDATTAAIGGRCEL